MCPFYVFDAVRRESFLEHLGENGFILLVGIAAFKPTKRMGGFIETNSRVLWRFLDFCAILLVKRSEAPNFHAMHFFKIETEGGIVVIYHGFRRPQFMATSSEYMCSRLDPKVGMMGWVLVR